MSGAVHQTWKDRYDAAAQEYSCPGCNKALKSRMSKSEKNPDRIFVSCAGCNMFCFIDQEYKPFGGGGKVFGGKAAAAPSSDAKAIADLKAEVATLASQFATLTNDMNVLRALVAQKPKHRSPKRESADEHSEHSNEEANRKKKSSKKTH